MGLFMSHLLDRRKKGDDEGALNEIQESYGRMTGLHASLVYGLSEDDVVSMLTVQGAVHPERLVALAMLLGEEGSIYSDRNEIEHALPRMQKALRLYLEAWDRSDALRTETIPGLDTAITWMAGYPIGSETRFLLMNYLEEKGRFDEVENYVLDWVESGSDESIAFAISFYRRLLELSDAELIVGGLTRNEIEAALDDLEEGQTADSESE